MEDRKLKLLKARTSKTNSGAYRGLYECFCGKHFETRMDRMNSGYTKSCGCLRIERNKKGGFNIQHGMTKSSEYIAWTIMKRRCYNPNWIGYKHYGGRGIKVCPRWAYSFEAFLKDMGFQPPGTRLERYDRDGSYRPGNCYWATREQRKKNSYHFKFSLTDLQQIKDLVDAGWSYNKIAKLLRIDRATIKRNLERLTITVKDETIKV